MGWFTYYRLLEKYDGDLEKASTMELVYAANTNPNDPHRAKELALRKWKEKEGETFSPLQL